MHVTENLAFNSRDYIVEGTIFLFLDTHQQDLYVFIIYLKISYEAEEAADARVR